MPQFFYAYFSGYSAMTCFDDFFIQLYNTAFTAIPPCCLAVVYWDINADMDGRSFEELLPKLYYVGQLRKKFNYKLFTMCQIQACFDAVVIFFICFQPYYYKDLMGDGLISSHSMGYPADMWSTSVTASTALVLVVHFNLFTRMKYMTYLHAVSIFGLSILSYLTYMWIYNYLPPSISQIQFVVIEAHKNLIFYLKITCCIAMTFLLDYALDCWAILIVENPTDYLRSLIYKGQTPDDPINRNHFNALVDREEAQARIKMSQQRQVTHLKKVQMRHKLNSAKFTRSMERKNSQDTPVGKNDEKKIPIIVTDYERKITNSMNAIHSSMINPQAQSSMSMAQTPDPEGIRGGIKGSSSAGRVIRTQNSALGTIRDGIELVDVDKESSGQSSSVYFHQTTQKKIMNGSSIRVSPSNMAQQQKQ